MKKAYWALSAAFLALTALLALIPAGRFGIYLRICSLATAIACISFVVMALNSERQKDLFSLKHFTKEGLPLRPNTVPPSPTMPSGIDPVSLAAGSLLGAVNALPSFSGCFSGTPMQRWQFERINSLLNGIQQAAQQNDSFENITEFAVRYLPSAMQYLSACRAEGCPKNASDVLADIASACEKQMSGLENDSAPSFETEYTALREGLHRAGFRWSK